MKDLSHFAGCLLGGALGDAMGWPIEFLSLSDIHMYYGAQGLHDLDLRGRPIAEITDDTQLMLFTADGLLRTRTRVEKTGEYSPTQIVYRSYLRWLHTQGVALPILSSITHNGKISRIPELFTSRAPDQDTLSALKTGKMGLVSDPINDSKGCGGIMRVSPVGLLNTPQEAFNLGQMLAAITHGHPTANLCAGAFAMLISCLIEGQAIMQALESVFIELARHDHHEEIVTHLKNAISLVGVEEPSGETIADLGEGFVAEEALAIAVYCALSFPNHFADAVRLSVNHSGDSDSTGFLCGSLMGTILGVDALPGNWRDRVELRDALELYAKHLFEGYRNTPEWEERYPPR